MHLLRRFTGALLSPMGRGPTTLGLSRTDLDQRTTPTYGGSRPPLSTPTTRDATMSVLQEPIVPRQALEAVLDARERRTVLRRQLVTGGRVLISLSLNIPGWPKTDPLFTEVFVRVRGELTRFLAAHLLYLDPGKLHDHADAAGDFYLAALRLR